MKTKTIQTDTEFRSYEIRKGSIDEESRTVGLSFSSEEPVERWFGIEVLDHDKNSVRLDRLSSGHAPLLLDHDQRQVIGVIEDVAIRDKRGEATVRFSQNEMAETVFRDVQDGIRSNISVGYAVHKLTLQEESDSGADIYRATDWEPVEVSVVGVPADFSIGVGRSDSRSYETVIETRGKPMSDDTQASEAPRGIDEAEVQARVDSESNRVGRLLETAEKYDAMGLVRTFIDDKSKDVSDLQQAILDRKPEEPPKEPIRADVGETPTSPLGLTDNEVQRFSIMRAIRAMANKDSRKLQEEAKFEFECSQAAQDAYGREAQGVMVPREVLERGLHTRDLTVGTGTAGGNLVATNLLSGSFIEFLYAALVIREAGAMIMPGLVGNVAIPRSSVKTTAYWVAESGSPTEGAPQWDQVTMSPKTVGAYVDISRLLMIQSTPAAEALVTRDMAQSIALEIDRVAINGDPDTTATANEPRGILQTSGIGSVVGATNGAAPDWDDVVNLVREVAIDNAAMGALRYLTNPAAMAKLQRTRKDSGSGIMLAGEGMPSQMNGFPVSVTTQVPSTLAKGSGSNLSAIIFGNFSDVILGEWSGVDILVDPYSLSTQGAVRVVALQDVDVAVRHATSFSAMTDAITT